MRIVELRYSKLDESYLFFKKLGKKDNPYFILNYSEYTLKIKERKDEKNLIYLIEDNDYYVGIFYVRTSLDEKSFKKGHIEFKVLEDYQNMAYATVGLYRLVRFIEVKEDDFYFTCLKKNKKALSVLLTNKAHIYNKDEKNFYLKLTKDLR